MAVSVADVSIKITLLLLRPTSELDAARSARARTSRVTDDGRGARAKSVDEVERWRVGKGVRTVRRRREGLLG